MTSRPHRYLTLAESLIQALRDGHYRPGDRLPSVRELCVRHAVSLATATHALHRLEDAGWIEARSRQGFFVRSLLDVAPPASTGVALQLQASRQRLMALAASQDGHVSLSHLALAPALLPLAPLRRLTSRHLRADARLLASGSAAGSEALREQLAKRLRRAGVRVGADDVVVTHGDGESLHLCLGLLVQPGDRVAVASPGSLRVLEVLTALGLQPVELPIAPNGAAAPELGAFLARERPAACVIDTSLFAAAAGSLSDAEKRSWLSLFAAYQVAVIEFDLMGELHRSAERGHPLKAFDEGDEVIHCGSLACVTGPGFSVGFIASGRHRLQLRAARTVHGELVPHLIDRVLAEFLSGDGFDTHLRRLRSRLRQQVAAWTRAVKRFFPSGTRISAGDAGYVLWVELPGGLSASDLLAQARAAGCTFVPGAVFSSTGRFDHCLRLAAGHPLDAFRATALQRLGEAAHQALGR